MQKFEVHGVFRSLAENAEAWAQMIMSDGRLGALICMLSPKSRITSSPAAVWSNASAQHNK